MADIRALFADYASYHQTKGNKFFHRLGIPTIVLTLLGMLARVKIFDIGSFRVDAAVVLIVLSTLYYLAKEWRLGIAMLGVDIVFYIVGAALPMWLNVSLFVLGWIFQFVGHSVYEKKSPAFLRNLTHLLIGPLWILNDVVPVIKSTNQAPI